ncbi:flagellar basal-body MS-ring/collar protein FliF [Paraburkholderia bonniea]|uniref:flagellar basal-body MS-ring/collar protein FliF n=1 Tax=Paraburkholderia bonniea TaxID=2152891 RepID=UPI001FE74FBE|nr:flagellar basal-body MS-ring/collar protein FliF [Paraburkholderia bonniea]WJF90772.1 flagellar basal-body MS-ring/collar protein FliF [Paraburkholderia bonniea]WJF94086.1 flagellar basal-body MS-ring/collar protein FliF [Paraburkholderia bonniea]
MLDKFKSLTTRWLPAGIKLPSSSALMKFMPVVILAVCLTALAMMVMSHQDGQYKPLFGNHEKVVAADLMAVLDAEHVPYRLHPESGQVLVPEARLGQVRMLLAAKGVVAKLPAGLEQVDKSDPLGVSQFVQDVRFRRGLEGELTQSIATLDPVAAARVHLSVAKSSSFILGDGDKSSASVVLTLKPGRKLTKDQVQAIVSLVAGSVANLDMQRIAVVDQAGNHLSALLDPNASTPGDDEMSMRIRQEALRNIQDLLLPSLGEGQFRASVTVDIDHDRIEETREQYGEAPKVTQEAVREESDSNPMALGIPGSLSNRPAPPSAASEPATSRAARNAQTRQYAYDRNVTQIKRSPARLKKLSVAVVLNNAAAPDQAKGWSPAQLEKIDTILRNGLGLDKERQDSLVVSALDFRQQALPEATIWWKDPDNIVSFATVGGYALAGLLLIFLVLRPLIGVLRQWVGARQVAATAAAERAELPHPAAVEQDSRPLMLLDNDPDLPPIGSDVDVLIEHLKLLAGQDPERVAEVIKPWIRKNG